MYAIFAVSLILVHTVMSCPLLDGLKGGIEAFRGETMKPRDGDMDEPKPLFIFKKWGQPPTMIENPGVKSDDKLKELAQQVSFMMGHQLGYDTHNLKLGTREMGKEVQQDLGSDFLSQPFKFDMHELPSSMGPTELYHHLSEQQTKNQQSISS